MTDSYTGDFHLSWDAFQAEARTLVNRLREKNARFDRILAVTRGGLFPAGIVACEMGIKLIDTVCVSSYDGQARGGITLLKKQLPEFETSVLVIDDLTDTGETMNFLRPLLPDAHFAALFVKPKGEKSVDTYCRKFDQETWIHFPWDPEES